MKKITLFFAILFLAFIFSNSIYAKTSFNVKRKSIKIYEKYDLSQIISGDSNNIKYKSSNESIATVSDDGIVFAKRMGKFTITATDGNSKTSCEFSAGFFVGIDVSVFNGNVDWKKVKDAGIDFAMIRSSFGWYDDVADRDHEYEFQFDDKLLNNLKGASENDISFGIYHFSYATTVEEAELEAEYVLHAINEYGKEYKNNMTLPIAYDIETDKAAGIGKAKLTQVAIAFCTKIYEAGYTPIIYSNTNFFNNYIDMDKLNALAYNYWYARPKTEPNFEEKITIGDTNISPFMWQYTFNGSIEGANTEQGTVDMDILYMKDRVKVEIQHNGKLIDTLGADKGGQVDELPVLSKTGYEFIGYKDNKNNNIDSDYIFNNNTVINPIFEKINIESIELNYANIEAIDKRDYVLEVSSFLPENAILDGEEFLFSSSDTKIAKVDSSGKVTPVSSGECTITCSLKSNANVKAECKVKVYFEYVKGDLDRNGYITANDAAIALDIYKNNSAKENDIKIGDMDENNIINAQDAAMILDMYKNGK